MAPNNWTLAVLVVAVAPGLASVAAGLQPAPNDSSRRSVSATARAAVVMDVTPHTQIWPKLHVAYDFDRQTVTMVQINEDGVHVLSVKPLNRVDGVSR